MSQGWKGVISRGVFPHQFAWILDLKLRRFILSPEILASRLALEPQFSALEVGAGSGYYSVDVARHLTAGRLELLDIQPEMLERCMAKIHASDLTNVGFTCSDATRLPFADAHFDIAYMVTVLGEVRDLAACLKSVRRVLRPNGLLSISEHLPDPDFITVAKLERLASPFGFVLEQRYGPRIAYTANFRAV